MKQLLVTESHLSLFLIQKLILKHMSKALENR